MAETDHADLERRLRIRRRNLARLKEEEKYIAEDETPPAVLDRIRAQIRVEREEVRLLERQVRESSGRRRGGSGGAVMGLSPRLGPTGRVLLVVVVAGIALALAVVAVPRAFQGAGLFGAPPTDTPAPTSTPVPPTPSSTATLVPNPTATRTPTPEVPTPTDTPSAPVGTVNVDVLNLRGGPGTTFGIRAKLTSGETLNLLGRNDIGTWLAVSTLDGATGWVAAEYVAATMMVDELPVVEAEE